MKRINLYSLTQSYAALGNNNGLSGLNGFDGCVKGCVKLTTDLFVLLDWCTTCLVGAAETAAPP